MKSRLLRAIQMYSLRVLHSSTQVPVVLVACYSVLFPAVSIASLASSILPTSRSTELGTAATAFASVINTGPGTATGCSISPITSIPSTFFYQTTDPATNALTGMPNTPVDIDEGAIQTFVFAFTSTAPFAPTEVVLNFDCTNTSPAASISGLNTLLLSASSTPVPDIIALATGTKILDLQAASGGNGAFAVATVNAGTAGTITASADTGAATLPVTLSVCQTNPSTGDCINPVSPAATATTAIAAAGTPTFAFFASATGAIPLDLANHRAFVKFRDSGGVTRGATSVALSAPPPAVQPQPNIVIFFSDDHTQQAISAYQALDPNALFRYYAGFETPNIDRLASGGAVFTGSFVSNSICVPSRANLLTGLHSHANGVKTNLDTFNGGQQTLSKLLQAAGYDTALIGKWHLMSEPTGFNHYERLIEQGKYYKPILRTRLSGGGTSDVTYTGRYIADVITDRSINWLENTRDTNKPFFMMVNHKATHAAWMPSPDQLSDKAAFDALEAIDAPEPPTLFDDYATRHTGIEDRWQIGRDMRASHLKLLAGQPYSEYNRMTSQQKTNYDIAYADERQEWQTLLRDPATKAEDITRFKYQRLIKDYARVTQTIDKSVGEVLDYLEANSLDRNTIIIYASDQGFILGEHEWWNKQWMYEESLNTPLLMQWKDGEGNSLIRPGSQVEKLVQVIDYGPTLLEAAGVSPSQPMHGESFLGFVTSAQGDEPAQWRDSIYYRYYQVSDNQTAPHYGVRNRRHKLIYFYPVGEWELFDLDNDPHELNNLLDGIDPEQGIPSDPELHRLVVDLMTELRDLRTQYGDTEGPGFSIPGDL